jgi:hypothetical protein
MYRRTVPIALLVAGCCSSICTALAKSPPAQQQAPELRLHVAGCQNMGEARGFSLVVEVSNPGAHALWYRGRLLRCSTGSLATRTELKGAAAGN